jgi:hypothetical protein
MTENMKVQECAASDDIWSWNLMKSWGEEDCQKSNHSFLDLDSGIKWGGSKVFDSLDNCHYETKLAGRK